MSYGCLILSEVKIDSIKRERYAKFDELGKMENFFSYIRMDYIGDEKYKIVNKEGVFFISSYGVDFFRKLRCREIYFNYFLLEKRVVMDEVVMKSVKSITGEKNKAYCVYLKNDARIFIEPNKIYKLINISWNGIN